MSLACGCDGDEYVTIDERDFTADGTIICPECGALVEPGDTYMRAWWWTIDDFGEERHLGLRELCYDCGGMADSILKLGYCYTFGGLRADIREMAEIERQEAEEHREWLERNSAAARP